MVPPDRGERATVMLIKIDGNTPVPPYEQLRAQLAARIADRTLPVGTRLPTIRQLAADLGLAANTVARAYRELEAAGLVETRGRAGSFVSAGGERARAEASVAARHYAATIRRLGLTRQEALSIASAALDVALTSDKTAVPATGSRVRAVPAAEPP